MKTEELNNQQLYIKLYDGYYKRVSGWFQKDFDRSTAEDLTQQTFMNLWIYFLSHPDEVPENERALIFRIAKNAKLDYVRKFASVTFEPDEYLAEIASSNSLEEAVEITCAINSLTYDEKQILSMKQAGLSRDEMAQALEISTSSVKFRLQKAREKLKKLI